MIAVLIVCSTRVDTKEIEIVELKVIEWEFVLQSYESLVFGIRN